MIFKKIINHKIISGIILILIIAGCYFGYKALNNKSQEIRYVLGVVEKGTIISSVSGSGQVLASNQLDIKSKASGDALRVLVENGQEVKAGTLLVQIDDTDAQKTVRDAEKNLQDAKLKLGKLEGIITESGPLRGTKEKAVDDLKKAYEDGFNTVTNIFLELPSIMSGLQSMFFNSTIVRYQNNIDWYMGQVSSWDDSNKAESYKQQLIASYNLAKQKYDDNFDHYKSASRSSDTTTIEALILETYETMGSVADTLKNANNYIDFVQYVLEQKGIPVPSIIFTHQSSLDGYIGKANSYLSSLLSTKTSIQNSKEAITNADLDINDQKIQVEEAEESLSEAKEKLSDYYIRAPFDGVIAKVNIKKGDSVSTNTTIATIITKQLIAEVTLNEVDAAKAKVGQKATLTFDAIEGLNITGKITEVDTLGTVSQGVVTYNVKITFDTQEEKVKSGMSVTTDTIIDVKPDVLVLPNSAVKSQGGSYYVELVETPEETKQQLLANLSGITLSTPPKTQSIEIGLSNDSSTEIVSGLKEGDIVITSTINSNTAKTTQTTNTRNQGFQIPGMGGR